MAIGVKTLNGVVGMDTAGRHLTSVVETAEASGRYTGLVTSVPFSHATPAAFSAHVNDRRNYPEIARQQLEESALDFIAGGGHPFYDDNANLRPDIRLAPSESPTYSEGQDPTEDDPSHRWVGEGKSG